MSIPAVIFGAKNIDNEETEQPQSDQMEETVKTPKKTEKRPQKLTIIKNSKIYRDTNFSDSEGIPLFDSEITNSPIQEVRNFSLNPPKKKAQFLK